LKKVFNQENLEKGKEIPSINGYGNGDLLVHVNVWTPKTLNKDQKKFFEKHDG
jgi:molecular chaperone DnaJ